MRKIYLILFLFCFTKCENINAQSVRVNFIRYKKIEYNNYLSQWQKWPVAWSESGAYAIIKEVYDETYKVSIYSADDDFIVSSTCTFDPSVTTEKRKAQNLPYLNCYTDPEEDQVWTNVVSLKSLIENVQDWRQKGAELYLWIFNGSQPFAFVFQ